MTYVYEFVGGELNGMRLTRDEVVNTGTIDGYTDDLSELRANGGICRRRELDNQPKVHGYLSPMWNGMRDGVAHLRYETQEVYNRMSY